MHFKLGQKIIDKIRGKKNKALIEKSYKVEEPIDVYEYIDKNYKYILNYEIDTSNSVESNYIWQYWGQGIEQAPELVKKCFESVKKYCPDKKIIVLDDNTVNDYIEIPIYIKEKLKNGIITKTHFSDYLRTCLLCKYGGTWIDATVFLTDNMPTDILDSDFFVFQPITYSLCNKCPSKKMLKLLEKIPTYLSNFLCLSSWFIHSKSNNIILKYVKNTMEEYWKKETKLIDYFLFHYLVTYVVLNSDKCREIFNNMPNKNNRNPHLLQNALLDEYDEELYNELKQLSPIHKLTYKESINKNSFMEYIIYK